jgi:hypothetical protein
MSKPNWLVLLCALAAGPALASDIGALLKDADRFRLAAEAARVEVRVQLLKSQRLERERRYTVYTKPGRRSLVISDTPSERGQKVLMLDDQYWIILPNSRRPIRITPMQKLLGDAATGDIATMTWSEDYNGVVAGERDVGGVPCLRLALHAVARGATYARIDLDIARNDHHPVQADLYVASGKLAKQARFHLGELDGRTQVTRMRLVDSIQNGQETLVDYLATAPATVPDAYYNPMYLVRSDLAN